MSPFQGKTRSWSLCGIWTGRPLPSRMAGEPPLSIGSLMACQHGPWTALARLGAPGHHHMFSSGVPPMPPTLPGSGKPQTSNPGPFGGLPSLPRCFLSPLVAFWKWATVSGGSSGLVDTKPGRQVCSCQLPFWPCDLNIPGAGSTNFTQYLCGIQR